MFQFLILSLFCVYVSANPVPGSELTDENVEIGFNLYTKLNPDVPQSLRTNDLESFKSSNFDPSHQIKIIIHGFTENYTNPEQSSQIVLKGFQCNGADFNYILIDYKTVYYFIITDYAYIHLQGLPEIVSNKIGQFITFIKKSYPEITNKNIDLIGFSLGGQIAGLVAQLMKDEKLNSITALDPAALLYEFNPKDKRLSEDDAKYIEIIHTTSLSGSISNSYGTSDIYVNYVKRQPNCGYLYFLPSNILCDHVYSAKLFARSLCEKKPFIAYECSKSDFLAEKCKENPNSKKIVVGGDPLAHESGIYHIIMKN